MEGPVSPDLERRLGLLPLTSIVVANMIGSGIFTTSGLLMTTLGSPLLMLALWVAGGIIAFCGALAYGELGAAMPHAGGEFTFLSRLYHPMAGFLSGWTSLIVGFSAPIAASAIGFSEYFLRAFPHITALAGEVWVKKGLSMLVIVLFTAIHMRGVDFGARIQNVLTVAKVGLIAFFVIAGLAFGAGDMSHFLQGKSPGGLSGWKSAGLSLMWIMFAYSGWNASTYVGSEVKDPARTIPRSLLLGTGVVMVLYLALNIVYVYAASPEAMKGVVSIGGLAMGNLFGRPVEVVASLLISFALFSSLSAFIILGPRVYFAMAREGLFFRHIAHVHRRFNAPTRAVAFQGGISILMVLAGTFEQILTVMGFALGIFPLLAVAGTFRLRRKRGSDTAVSRYPWASAIYLVCGAAILIFSFCERPVESFVSILGVLSGIPVYFSFRRR
jgi:APA family basic amino acid/polyamine antiporter